MTRIDWDPSSVWDPAIGCEPPPLRRGGKWLRSLVVVAELGGMTLSLFIVPGLVLVGAQAVFSFIDHLPPLFPGSLGH